MNATTNTNGRLTTILLILVISLLILLIVGIIAVFFTMDGMMGMGTMTLAPGASAGVNGGMMNGMYSACLDMMKSYRP